MKQIFIFVILSIALIGCETYTSYGPSRYSVNHISFVQHIDTGKSYSMMNKIAHVATSNAKLKCKRENPNNQEGCLLHSIKNYYNDGSYKTLSYWNGTVAKYNSQFNNNRINELESLIKDFENGKISRSEFNRKKKELIEN